VLYLDSRLRPGTTRPQKNLHLARAIGAQLYPRLADHRPEQGPRVPWPDQLPPPELPCSLPLPLPLEPPDETLTETAPLPETLPETPAGPEMTPLLMLMPTLVLGSHEPRVVWIETLQLPSKEAAPAAVVMAATAIKLAAIKLAAIVVASRVGVDLMFMGTTFGDEFHNLMTFR
jgi:hypothetical protein